jgi:hypothetical protein
MFFTYLSDCLHFTQESGLFLCTLRTIMISVVRGLSNLVMRLMKMVLLAAEGHMALAAYYSISLMHYMY